MLMSLSAPGLPASFDLTRDGEKPLVDFGFENGTLRFTYRFPGFTFADLGSDVEAADRSEETRYRHEVGIAGTGFLSESGKPLLPSFGRFVQIPPGYGYRVRIEKAGLQRKETVRVRPAQEAAEDQEAWALEFDQQTYSQDRFYPDEIVDVSGPLYLDGYRVLCVHVRPMQYNPVQEVLQCFSAITVMIDLLAEPVRDDIPEGGREVPTWAYLDPHTNLEGFGNFLFNPERKYFEKNPLPAVIDRPVGIRPAIPEYLIIHDAAFEEAARRLRTWKMKCGLDTAIVCVDAITGSSGDSSKEVQVGKIKAHIRAMRREPLSPLRYVLLFGDVDRIPTEERPRPDSAQRDTTDYYYFTHRDATASECLLPWVAGGRIAARDAGEALAVVDQIVRYEKDPPSDPEYYRRMVVAGFFEDCDAQGRQDGRADRSYLKTMETIRSHMRSNGFEVRRVYVSNHRNPEQYSDGTPVPLEVREEMIFRTEGAVATRKLLALINEGQLIIGHRGHGSFRGWKDPALRMEDLKRIRSTVPSIFFSINCRTGSFDGGQPCFAEGLLAADGGAPSLIAATEFSGAWRNDSMIKALYDGIWPGVIPTYPVTTVRLPVKYFRLGDLLNYAKSYLLAAHGVNANTQKHLEIYHVVGDPTLHIWGSEPMPLRLHARIKGDILVVNMNTSPQEGVLSVWYEDECLWKTKPSGPRMAIPLMLLGRLPDDARSPEGEGACKLSVYFSAAGHRLAEAQLWF